jgi:hypothetical protein
VVARLAAQLGMPSISGTARWRKRHFNKWHQRGPANQFPGLIRQPETVEHSLRLQIQPNLRTADFVDHIIEPPLRKMVSRWMAVVVLHVVLRPQATVKLCLNSVVG